jgi:hypothetical protein
MKQKAAVRVKHDGSLFPVDYSFIDSPQLAVWGIINNATGHVSYARTHGHSTMGVATGHENVSTNFDVPAAAETGSSSLEVVANGIASESVTITVTLRPTPTPRGRPSPHPRS